ncbi:hypothetical protein [Natronolimnobius sp. AArcel1]|uniref:BACON domain-containing protein n=1 Tax=Natronolimnobius sp. AArcel1 TaxID=1679093 RepID=UPI001F156A75|nr:hypothetical protein [Natronolimnobius sp. AArcel1]
MRSRLYAGQGQTAAEMYAQYAENAFAHLETATRQYNATADGKWRRMLSANPRELPAFDLPATGRVTDEQEPTLEVTVEGEAGVAGTGVRNREVPTIVQGLERRRFIDCYNRGSGSIEWTATANEAWLTIAHTSGTLEEDERLWVGVDWDDAPDEPTTGTIQIAGAGRELEVSVPIRPRPLSAVGEDTARTPLFVESNDRIALDAEGPTALEQGETRWEPVDGLSRTTGTTMVSRPLDGPRLAADAATIASDAARLEYDLEISSAAEEVCIEIQLLPTHAPTDETPHRYAVAVGDGEPRVVDFDANGGEHDPQWQENVCRSSVLSRTHHEVSAPGRQTLSVYAVDPSVVIDRIVVYTDDDTRRSSLGPRETRDRRLE